jgi:type VI protein secretion system component VasK
MSTLKADTIQSTGGGAATLTKQSAAKVTGNLQPDGSSNSTVSMNISSVTDGGTGLNTVAVSNAFTAALAVAALISNHDSSYNRHHTVDDASASSFITRSQQSSVGSLYDGETAHSIAFFGDLA